MANSSINYIFLFLWILLRIYDHANNLSFVLESNGIHLISKYEGIIIVVLIHSIQKESATQLFVLNIKYDSEVTLSYDSPQILFYDCRLIQFTINVAALVKTATF